MSFSKYAKDAEGPSAQDAVEYMSAPAVPKPTFRGIVMVRRDPAPEILMGDPAQARAAIRMAPGLLKYRSAVVTFAAEDVDVAAFNGGDPSARGAVDLAVGLWTEVGFAGVPPLCRPPVFATTHTHLGRLEVNLLAPRWITRSDGALRSFNIDPPGPASRAMWDAFEDLLNHRFGWSDPRDPARRRLVHVPDWHLKQQRTAERAGETWTPDLRSHLVTELTAAASAGHLCDRATVLAHVLGLCQRHGLVLHGVGSDYMTIGAPDAPAAQRIRLKGQMFAEDFAGVGVVSPEAVAARVAELTSANTRLETAWLKRALFNASRYGLGAWPEPSFHVRDWSAGPKASPPRWIPANRLSTITLEPRHAAPPIDLDTYGASAPATDPSPLAVAFGAGIGAGPQDRSTGSGGSGARPGYRDLDRYARTLAGPVGPGRIFAALTARFLAVLPRLDARLTLQRFARAIPDTLSILPRLAQTLETLNASLAHHKHRAKPVANPVRNPDNNGGDTDGSDLAASPVAGGAGRVGRHDHRADGNHHALPWYDCGELADDGRSPYSKSGSGGLGVLIGTSNSEDGGAAAAASPGHHRHRPEHEAFDRLARRSAPPGSRGEFLRELRQTCERVVPGSPISLRILQTYGAHASPGPPEFVQGRDGEIQFLMSPGEYCCLSGPADAMAILAGHIVPDAPDPGDPAAGSDQDHSAGPDYFG
jgi:hypothetical protein